jgi:hypothetical protein
MEFCSPSAIIHKRKHCYTKENLITIINAWNILKPESKIIIKSNENPNSIFNKLNNNFERYLKEKNTYWAWIDIIKFLAKKSNNNEIIEKMKIIEKEALRPPQPTEWIKNPVEWLSNFDIDKVIKQYERFRSYKYKFLGVHSIDFGIKDSNNNCLYSNNCHINLKEILKSNKIKYIGFITNLSRHNEPGTHWTSSFFVLDPSLKSYGGYYYDSTTGNIPKDLMPVFNDIKKQAEDLFNKPFNFSINKNRHQKSNTECGVFSIAFQTRWISLLRTDKHNTTFDKIVNFSAYKDDNMKLLRFKFFRPNIKTLKLLKNYN